MDPNTTDYGEYNDPIDFEIEIPSWRDNRWTRTRDRLNARLMMPCWLEKVKAKEKEENSEDENAND